MSSNAEAMNSASQPKVARQIPASRYTSRDWEDLESERLWTRVWQIACTEDCVPEPGDYWEYEIGPLSIFVLRDEEGVLRAFKNVCPHRGTSLIKGSGCGLSEVRCPYHHWRYDLKGHLCGTDQNDVLAGRPGPMSLVPVSVDSWGGFVFVNPDPNCEPLDEFLEVLPEELAWVGMEDFGCSDFLTLAIPCNWKLVVDAFIETYHLHAVHPQMLAIADDVNTPITLFDKHTMFMQPYGVPSPRRNGSVSDQELWEEFIRNLGHRLGLTFASTEDAGSHPEVPEGQTLRDVLVTKIRGHLATLGTRYAGLDDNHIIDDFHYHIFPNSVFNVFAGWYGLIRARPGPTPGESFIDMWNFDLRPKDHSVRHPRPEVSQLNIEDVSALGSVLPQDLDILMRAQKGLRQAGVEMLRLTPAEARIGRMHEILDRYIDPPVDQRLP
jgi:phenylpropionate dioxygenase-like ring-hydroxylating dioxygenase large terminal subunit